MAKSALVVGGGFAGLEAAIHLRKAGLDVTLVSERPYLWMYPTSIWVVTGEAVVEEVRLDLLDLARRHGFAFRQEKVESISAAQKAVVTATREYSADHLVLAIGGTPLRPKGVEHTFGLSGGPENASRVHDALEKLIEHGSGRIAMGFGGNPKDPSAVRGGPVFEVMFNVAHMLRKRGIREKFQLTLFAPMPSPGERMGKKAVAAIQKMFAEMGVEMRFGKKIERFEAGGAVVFEDGSRLESDLTVFIPAGSGHPVFAKSDLPLNEAGFVQIDEGCAVFGFPGVWAVGDSAALDGPAWRAKQGHLAEVMARVAASNIRAEVEGRTDRESYLPHVSITCLMDMGNGAAYVHRDATKEQMVPLPVVGHWMKKGWGAYFKASKRKQFPRLPGM